MSGLMSAYKCITFVTLDIRSCYVFVLESARCAGLVSRVQKAPIINKSKILDFNLKITCFCKQAFTVSYFSIA